MIAGPPVPPAGIVTRALAAAVDLVVVIAMSAGAVLGVAVVRFALSPVSYRWSSPPWSVVMACAGVAACAYLTIAWAATGRTFGAAVLGLRVRSTGGGPLGWTRAALRAALCLVFPVGLLWVAISPRRRSVQDLLLLTVVVYDWCDDTGLQGVYGPADSPVTDGEHGHARGQRAHHAHTEGRKGR